MAKNNNNETIFLVAALVVLLFFVSQTGVTPLFSIVTKTVCTDNEISYYDLDEGTVLGKFNNAMEFNTTNSINIPQPSDANATTMWIKDYANGDTNYFFVAEINGLLYVNNIRDNSKPIIQLGPQFGLNFNGSIDDVATYTELSLETLDGIYNNGTGREVCYTETYEENITCMEYATTQINDTGTGCINYSGEFFPNCEYSWDELNTYKLVNNICVRQLYCADGGLTLATCESQVTTSDDTSSSTTSSSTTSSDTFSVNDGLDTSEEDLSFRDKLNKKVFTIAGFDITIFHLIILAGILFIIIYYLENRK